MKMRRITPVLERALALFGSCRHSPGSQPTQQQYPTMDTGQTPENIGQHVEYRILASLIPFIQQRKENATCP